MCFKGWDFLHQKKTPPPAAFRSRRIRCGRPQQATRSRKLKSAQQASGDYLKFRVWDGERRSPEEGSGFFWMEKDDPLKRS